jgi:undecaprenyl-diphosphatase
VYAWRGWKGELAIVGGLASTFAVLLLTVSTNGPTAFDRWLMGEIQGMNLSSLGAWAQWASDFGGGMYGVYVIPAVAGLVLAAKRQWRALALVAAVFALHYAFISPKLFIETHRPSPAFGVEGAGGLESFPSGHVEWAVSLYGFLAYLVARSFPRFSLPIAGVYATVVVMTMLSRIELGRHWPIDTIAGLLVGLIAVRLLVALHVLPGWRRQPEPAQTGQLAPSPVLLRE